MMRVLGAAATASIAMIAFAIIVQGCSSRTPAGAAGGTKYVRISGTGTLGDAMRVTWGPDAGSLTTEHAGGATERLWFDRHATIRSGVSGDVYRLDGQPAPIEQAERLLLTGRYNTMHVVGQVTVGHQRVTTYSAPNVMSIVVSTEDDGTVAGARIASLAFGDFRFDGSYATRWKASGGAQFEATTGPQSVTRFEPEPPAPWQRDSQPGRRIDASVDGIRARIVVDTATEGLAVSPSFAAKIRAEPVRAPVRLRTGFAADIMDVQAPVRLVKLRRVTLAGKTVDRVFARLADDDRYDLRAGIGLFPHSAIALTRDGVGRLSNAACTRGVHYNPWDGRVIAYEPGGRFSHATLLSTAHEGRPLRRSFDSSLVASRQHERCDSRRTPITFGGRTFGSDFVCNRGSIGLKPTWDAVVGLHSLGTSRLIVDTRNNTVCWP